MAGALREELPVAVAAAVKDLVKSATLCKRLAAYARKRNTTTTALWSEVASRTDQLFVAAEAVAKEFQSGLAALAAECNAEDVALVLSGLKDPIRVAEKAHDDYQGRVAGVEPEAWVADVLRARLVFRDAAAHTAALRLKNKYRSTDPTHFRNFLLNFRVHSGKAASVPALESSPRRASNPLPLPQLFF